MLAAAAAAVSFTAQYRLVYAARRLALVAGLEAAIPDAAALVFACLGVALALHGRRAVRARELRPMQARRNRNAEPGLLPDISAYERLMNDGVEAAKIRGSTVDHVTARRLAIWLAARPQSPDLARGLVRFIRTGAITEPLKAQLRIHSRSPGAYPDQAQATMLLRYCAAHGADHGPIGPDFGTACDRIDHADVMLAELRDQVQHGTGPPEPTWPDAEGPQILAPAPRDQKTGTVSLILDTTTANIAVYAIAAHATDREAHVREVEQVRDAFPEGSYGKRNRQAIAARESRIAGRLRAVEQAYRIAIERDRDATPETNVTPHAGEREAYREIELE